MNNPTDNHPAFDLYMDKVNDHLWDLAQVSDNCIPDYDFWSTFEAGIPAKAAARDALDAAATF